MPTQEVKSIDVLTSGGDALGMNAAVRIDEAEQPTPAGSFIGLLDGETHLTSLEDVPRLGNRELRRPREQWWLALQTTTTVMARFKRQG